MVASARIAVILCVLLLAGCDRRDTLQGDYCAAPPTGIVQGDPRPDPGTCPFWAGPCHADYFALPDRAPASAITHITDDELEGQFGEIRSGDWPMVEGDLEPAELADAVVEAANIGWLLDGLETRELKVTEWDSGDEPGWRYRSWMLEDEYVGKLRGVTILPDGEGPFPAIVVAHGHTEADWEWIEQFDGWELTRRGFAVIVPTLRNNEADQAEHDVTMHLLRSGLTFAGVRVYEHLLAQKYAASLPYVDPCRIGLVGHSGGAVTGNLTIRVSVGFTAYVSDLASDYFTEAGPTLWLDETAPALNSLYRQVNDFDRSHRPILKLGYNYETETSPTIDQRPDMWAFLEENVRDLVE